MTPFVSAVLVRLANNESRARALPKTKDESRAAALFWRFEGRWNPTRENQKKKKQKKKGTASLCMSLSFYF